VEFFPWQSGCGKWLWQRVMLIPFVSRFLIHVLAHPDPSLLIARPDIAETSVIALATQSTGFPNHSPPLSFATDASTILQKVNRLRCHSK
jgi:hypothetical protein